MLRNVPSSKEVAQIILVSTVENANLSLKMIMNVFVVKNSGNFFSFIINCVIFIKKNNNKRLISVFLKRRLFFGKTTTKNFGWYLLFSIWPLAYQM